MWAFTRKTSGHGLETLRAGNWCPKTMTMMIRAFHCTRYLPFFLSLPSSSVKHPCRLQPLIVAACTACVRWCHQFRSSSGTEGTTLCPWGLRVARYLREQIAGTCFAGMVTVYSLRSHEKSWGLIFWRCGSKFSRRVRVTNGCIEKAGSDWIINWKRKNWYRK